VAELAWDGTTTWSGGAWAARSQFEVTVDLGSSPPAARLSACAPGGRVPEGFVGGARVALRASAAQPGSGAIVFVVTLEK